MRLTFRSLLVIVIGVAVSFALYVAADQWLDMSSGVTMNSNFSPVFSAWRELGGTVGPIEIGGGEMGGEGGAPFGGPPFLSGRGGHHAAGFGEGIDVERAGAQFGSDLLWIGVPALLGVAIELVWWHTRKRKPREAPSTSTAGDTE
jgi:hypothetical protein